MLIGESVTRCVKVSLPPFGKTLLNCFFEMLTLVCVLIRAQNKQLNKISNKAE